MKDALDFAPYFMKHGFDAINATPNTIEGDVKINKLCVLANLVSIAEFGSPLFEDDIVACAKGDEFSHA